MQLCLTNETGDNVERQIVMGAPKTPLRACFAALLSLVVFAATVAAQTNTGEIG